MICFTSDIDWAPEEVIYDTLKIFEEFGIKCTIFATHESEALKKCNKNLFEIGLHPNLNEGILNGKGKGAKNIISEFVGAWKACLKWYENEPGFSILIQTLHIIWGVLILIHLTFISSFCLDSKCSDFQAFGFPGCQISRFAACASGRTLSSKN